MSYRGGSPDYRPPRRARSPSYEAPRGRRRSPSYEAPRGRRRSPSYEAPSRGRRSPRGRSPSYEAPRGRSSSGGASKARGVSLELDHGVSPPRGAPVPTLARFEGLKRSRSRSPLSGRPSKALDYPWEDEEILRTLNCKACNVYLHDRDSMLSHLKGAPHLLQQQRIRDKEVRAKTGGYGLNDVLKVDNVKMNYDNDFWDKQKQKPRVLRPEQERFLDIKRLDNVPAKYDHRNYDHGQFKFKKEENYCDKCDVWTKTRDQMQAHKEGANHRKMSAKVQRYRCKLCLIDVPCQDTLDNHMRGKDHIKREKQLQEQRKEKGEVVDGEGHLGYKTGPREMAKLDHTEREELEELRKTVKILRAKVQEQNKKHALFKKEHGTDDMEKLRQKVKWCQENHLRPQEFNRPGIHCKKEPESTASTSRSIKTESKYQSRVSDRGENKEYMEDQQDSKT